MTITLESLAATFVGLPLLFGYVCRVAKVNWWQYKPLPVAFHVFGGAQVLWLMREALHTGSLGPGWVAMGFAAAWLVWSYGTWRDGAPEHTLTEPAPFADTAQAPQPAYVLGRREGESRWLQ